MNDIREQILADAIEVCIKDQQTIRRQNIIITVLSVAIIILCVIFAFR